MTNTETHIQLDSIESAVAALKAGEIIIVVDDEDRENEGDFVCAAECVTPAIINFMATRARGLICAPITEERAKELQLNQMVSNNTDVHGTAFTVSIDYRLDGCTTGISAYDRATGIKALTSPNVTATDFCRPGHIFPLVAKQGGVLRRTGHTEASIDLAQMAGYAPAAAIVEILNPDGTMARLPQLAEIAKRYDMRLISIKDLVAYRMERERLVRRDLSLNIDTPFGPFELISFKEMNTSLTHLVLKKGEWTLDEPVMARVHASSDTAELFASFLKDTGEIFHKTLAAIEKEGRGVLLLLRHEEQEQDIITATMKALKQQQEKGEKLFPFLHRSKELAQKNIGIGAQILHDLGIRKIRLMSNTTRKRVGLIGYGLEIVEQVKLNK